MRIIDGFFSEQICQSSTAEQAQEVFIVKYITSAFIKVNSVKLFIELKKYKGKNWHLGAGLVAWHKVHRHCEHCFLDLFIWINLSPLKRLVKEKMNVKNKKDYRLIFFSFLFSGKRHHPAAKDFYQVELLIFNKMCGWRMNVAGCYACIHAQLEESPSHRRITTRIQQITILAKTTHWWHE